MGEWRNRKCGRITWPPTTATEGRASQRDVPSPPWSPRTVQALWIRFTRPIKLSMVAIVDVVWKEGELGWGDAIKRQKKVVRSAGMRG